MSKLNYIPLNEIDDLGKVLKYDSYEAIGGDSKDLALIDFACNLKIHRAGDGYYIIGQIDIKRDLPCSLCSQESPYSQTIAVEEFLRVDPKFDTPEMDIAKSDESNSMVVRSQLWNFKEFIRESILVEEPYQFYAHDGGTVEACPEYENLVKKGILTPDDENKGNKAFEALKNLRL